MSFYLCVYEAEAEVRGHSSRSRDEDDFLRSISEPKERCLFRGQHHRGGHLHPVSAIVKPMLEDPDGCKASMPDCKNVKKIAAILSM